VDMEVLFGLAFVKYSETALFKFDCLQVDREISCELRREFGAFFNSLES
jgi:hypothetical protein